MKDTLSYMWKLPSIPIINHFIWKCLRGILPTKARTLRYSANAYISYPMCGLSQESASHIILQCQYSRAVWFGSTGLQFGSQSLIDQESLSWISQFKRGDISSEVLTRRMVSAWAIWKERCSKVLKISFYSRKNLFTEFLP